MHAHVLEPNIPGVDESWQWQIDKTKARPILPHDQQPGVYVGSYYDEETKRTYWLRDPSDRHVLLVAPTRAGKGVSFAVPNVLTYPQSTVIHDLKGELWALTARYRRDKLDNLVFRFEATCNDGTGACFNPLDEVRLKTDYEVADAQNIATLIVDPDGKGFSGENAHWARTARSFLVGAILHVLYFEDDKTMHGLDAFLSHPRMTQMQIFERMLQAEHDPLLERGWIDIDGEPTSTMPEVAMAARDMIERPEGERGSVMSSVKSFLDIYRDPIIAKNTCRSDFSIQDLMQNDRPVTLYIVNNPSDMDRSMPLTRLLFNFIMRGFTRSMKFDKQTGRPIKSYKHPLLLLMDEFNALGNLSIFASALSFVAGFGIRVMIIAQDFVQLAERYGDFGARGIMANMHIKIMYAPGDPTTAAHFSNMLGKMTVRYHSKSGTSNGKAHWTEHLDQREMLTSDEFMALGSDQAVVHVMNQPAIACGRITYYKEATFQRRVLPQLEESNCLPREQQAGTRLLEHLRKEAAKQAEIRKARAAQTKRQRDQESGAPAPPGELPVSPAQSAAPTPWGGIATAEPAPAPSAPVAGGSLVDKLDAAMRLDLDDGS
jgi:type IV secretion system protein VirD4